MANSKQGFVYYGSAKRTEIADWRHMFKEDVLKEAEFLVPTVKEAKAANYYLWTPPAYCFKVGTGRNTAQVMVISIPRIFQQNFSPANFSCSCRRTNWKDVCVHVAAVCLHLEKTHGPFYTEESDYTYAQRQNEEKRQHQFEALEKEWVEKKDKLLSVKSFFSRRKSPEEKAFVFFDVAEAIRGLYTNEYYKAHAQNLRGSAQINMDSYRDGTRDIDATASYYDGLTYKNHTAKMILKANHFEDISCSCHRLPQALQQKMVNAFDPEEGKLRSAFEYGHVLLCEHELDLIRQVWDYVDASVPGDATDTTAESFFQDLEKTEKSLALSEDTEQKKLAGKPRDIQIVPRIVVDLGEAKLSFKIGRKGGRLYVIKNLGEMVYAADHDRTLPVSKNESIDFSASDFTEESQKWKDFIARRLQEIQDINDKIQERSYRYNAPSLKVNSQQDLTGPLLDYFYDAAEGTECEFQDKFNDVKNAMIHVGHKDISFTLKLEKIEDSRGKFAGITVSGMIPVLISGSSSRYLLNEKLLSRVNSREQTLLQPFLKASDAAGFFIFRVGLNRFQEFYYRVLPRLMESPSVNVVDHCGDEARSYLPPEPAFTFYVDYIPEKGQISCRCMVAYEEKQFTVESNPAKGSDYHDVDQEGRVRTLLTKLFHKCTSDGIWHLDKVDDDILYDFLQSGMRELNAMGEVRGTEFFRRQKVVRIPAVQVGVSVESGLMDITVTSRDADPEELLSILESYHQKKRFYKLKDGSFVDLAEDEQVEDLEAFFRSMDLVPIDAIRQKIHIPVYRALYLDRMLEEHEQIVSTRDRTYRALIRNFRTIQNSEYEAPSSLEGTMRPYQVYGFKWIRTLEDSGFGGILADEMGLGKTLQMISAILSDKERGVRLPSLVVCPASVVFNWAEEFARFAPSLQVCALAGVQAVRRQLLKELAEENGKIRGNKQKKAAEEEVKASEAGRDEKVSVTRRSRPLLARNKNVEPQVLMAKKKALEKALRAEEKKKEKEKAKEKAKELLLSEDGPKQYDVYITSYDLLKRDIDLYDSIQFNNCVLDEAQFIKNQKAAVSKAVKILHCDHRYALTGTPIENRLSELWSIFDFLMPGFLYSSSEFIRRFENPIAKARDEETSERLKKIVGPFILRRLKVDVLKDLPDKLEEVRYARFSGEQQKLYDAQVLHMKQVLASGELKTGEDKLRILAELTKIRQICCDPSLLFENYHGESAKRAACMDLIRSAIDGGHRMLIFSQFTSMLALLEQDLNEEQISYFKITGSTPKQERVALMHRFNEGDTPVFLVSLKAGGTGLNLTGADVVIHYDPWWNMAAQNQATDRAHRIGQTREVTVYRMIMKDTIEEKILELQESKKDLADAILSGANESLTSLSSEELMALLES